MPLPFNLALLFYAWLVLFVLQLAVGPTISLWLPRLADRGWAFGRLVGWLIISLVIWNLSYFQVPANQQMGIWAVFLSLIIICGLYNLKHRGEFKQVFRRIWRVILLEEILFFAGFIFLGLVRSFNPDMLDLEKFMDGGIIASYLHSPLLPAQDMWLAGLNFNYYTFGHFMGAILTHIWAIDLAYSYNLLLAVLFAMTLAGGFSLVFNLVNLIAPKITAASIWGGLVAAILLVFGGNSHTLWYLLQNKSLTGYWYAEATRFIEFTIHEFPSYSFVVSDLHAHVWDLPIVLLFLVLSFVWFRSITEDQTSHRLTLVLGFLLGVMGMTNTWDSMVYGVYLGLVLLLLLVVKRVNLVRLIFSGIEIAVGAVVAIYWWWINFTSISDGVRAVAQQSPLWQLVALWGTHVFLGLVALTTSIKLTRAKKIEIKYPLILALVVTAFFFLALPEFVFFKDIYPSHPRANTMFKLTYQAFVLLMLIVGWLVGEGFNRLRRSNFLGLLRGFLALAGATVFLLFPAFAYKSYYGEFRQQKYLNGLNWMQQESEDDYQLVLWLKQQVAGRPVVLEAVGESYSRYARISANTGLPTVLGWRVHEWLWRNGFDIPAKRTEEVRSIYEHPLSAEAQTLISQYRVRFIVIGDTERTSYHLDEAGLSQLGPVVFQSGKSKIIEPN